MRRSRRLSAETASRMLFSQPDSDISDCSSSSDSSDSDSEDNIDTSVVVEDNSNNDWHIIAKGTDTYEPEHVFTGAAGLQRSQVLSADDVDYFVQLYLTDELFEMLASWTNSRAEIALEDHDVDPSADLPAPLSRWRPVTTLEIKKVLGILICMQLNHKPEMRSYWSRSLIYKSDFFNDSRCLPRNRFEEILRYLRFCDYNNLDDKLAKIRPFLTYVQDTCKNPYIPSKEICIDESLLLYKGRLQFRRYIPSKRARYGILSYCLCESSTGYTWNIHVAAGREENDRFMSHTPEQVNVFPFSEKIVVVLVSTLLDKGYHLFVDNFFSSVRFARFLCERSTLLTATIRPQR